MRELETIQKEKLQQLETIICNGEEFMKSAPEGKLRISKCKNTDQYYWKKKTDQGAGQYIRRSQLLLAKSLAQKEYLFSVLKIAKRKYVLIQSSKKAYDFSDIEVLYNKLMPAKKKLVEPVLLSDDEYAVQWEEGCKQYISEKNKERPAWKYQLSEEDGIMTEKGDVVRSKSEKIFADKLYMLGIPYVYEMPLYLSGYGYIHPDFTVLNKRTRKIYYWEHFGMMDEPEYSEKAIKKIELYEKNKIYQGRELIVTYESKNYIPNIKVIEKKLEEMLK